MIVIDCSAVLALLLDPEGNNSVGAAIGGAESLAAPDLIDVEMISALRRLENLRRISRQVADRAVDHFLLLQIERFPAHDLVRNIWKLRNNFSAYDAAYVALARSLKAPLLTRDGKLRRAVTEITNIALI
ncbi:MAG: type II toxin-antitoxin system VapC family toxin [Hyphomicrobiales bacterium]